MEDMVTQSSMSWEFIKPGMLTNGPLTSNYKIISQLFDGVRINKISRADVADYLVKEAEYPRFLRHHVALTV